MDVDFGASLIMLLRWLGSVVVIIGGIAAVALLIDWLREVSRRRSFGGVGDADGSSAPVSIVPDLERGPGVGDTVNVSSLDAARADRADDSTGARVA